MRIFDSILVANRGEIAVRVMRTAKALGYRAIAVYSEADAGAPHVRIADDAVMIGPAPVGESYLAMDRILTAAKESGARAIHPGYGFLAENADFARASDKAGLIFIGPDADVIALMGNKAEAKRRMIDAGVPCIPGYEGEDQSDQAMVKAAKKIGYPLMVKAAAGGGGRGMRLVEKAKDLADALKAARSEALNAFASDQLILEKAIFRPRHVEIQVFADSQGNSIHLGERDCSVQRRHQKVVEEAPCPVMTQDLRARMGQAAVDAARSIGYRGAGTVEFLLDGDGAFYFLEMNTRLQVEHPVTEMITGLDLVALQIQVAQGLPLGLAQDDVTFDGHAIEVRLYAEDPAQGFLPVTGRIDIWRGASGEGVRIDAGIESGLELSPFYDPLVAKIIAWGDSREIARHRLIEALKKTVLFGTTTNKGFLIDVLERERFATGDATTAFIGEEFGDADLAASMPTFRQAAIAAVVQFLVERQQALDASVNVSPALLDWSSGGLLTTRYVYTFGDADMDLTVAPHRQGHYVVRHGEDGVHIDVIECADISARLTVDGRRQVVFYSAPSDGVLDLSVEGRTLHFRNRIAFAAGAEEIAGGGRVVAPMHGALLEVLVKPGDEVEVGTRLAVLEAMKMQHDILAEVDGTVREVLAAAGNQVAANDVLIEIEAA
ncbi:MAG: acetyl-CoA carboxylase biotin carboxylase subunit [Alphaproteobacteria bacterium]|jgi:geranyl-CoA carboxylase alpha subunit|nr:acetyl-CoA carboxylase biotin carboxylase subunit [Alphaproteobacteria bacterium]